MNGYTFQTSAAAIAAVVEFVANKCQSMAPLVEFQSGPALNAAKEAVSLGFLSEIGNEAFEMSQLGRGMMTQKDPVGYVLNIVAIKAFLKDRKPDPGDLLYLSL